jgi:Co/Zn/Cd efflux system component
MSVSCCGPQNNGGGDQCGTPAYRRVLWIALAINAAMFAVEVGAGLHAGSSALQADALDFFGDAANYAVSLFVVGMALRVRASAALVKGATMGLFGLWVVGVAVWHAYAGTVPGAFAMGAVGFTALVANALSFGLLWAHRDSDSNMRSAWICTRNDVLGNLAVLLASLGVFGTGKAWPDIFVALIMAGIAIQGAILVIRHALLELRPQKRATTAISRPS